MTRHVVVLVNDRLRERAIEYVRAAKPGSRVEFKGPQRKVTKNNAMWAMLSDIARGLVWFGRRLDAEAWKLVFLDALRREHHDEMQLVPNIDKTGFVNISGNSSSDLDDQEMSDLLTIIRAFGDQHGIEWSEPESKTDDRPVVPIEAYTEEVSR